MCGPRSLELRDSMTIHEASTGWLIWGGWLVVEKEREGEKRFRVCTKPHIRRAILADSVGRTMPAPLLFCSVSPPRSQTVSSRVRKNPGGQTEVWSNIKGRRCRTRACPRRTQIWIYAARRSPLVCHACKSPRNIVFLVQRGAPMRIKRWFRREECALG